MTTVDLDQLLESAQDFSHRALTAYLNDDRRVILVFAAIAMEHLSKAFLCSLHPTLLTDLQRGSVDSLLHLAHLGDRAKKLPYPRTISSKDALKRVEHVLPSLAIPQNKLHELIDVRDGVIHVGYLESTSTKDLLAAFLRYADALYDEIGITDEKRWGEHQDLVDALVIQSLDDVRHRVQLKVSHAKRRSRKLMQHYTEKERRSLHWMWLHLLHDQAVRIDCGYLIMCPICDDFALAGGEGDYTPSPNIGKLQSPVQFSEVWLRRVTHLKRFICPLCKLSLDSEDEIKAAEIALIQERWERIYPEGLGNRGRFYAPLKPVGSRQPPWPQNSDGFFSPPAEKD